MGLLLLEEKGQPEFSALKRHFDPSVSVAVVAGQKSLFILGRNKTGLQRLLKGVKTDRDLAKHRAMNLFYLIDDNSNLLKKRS